MELGGKTDLSLFQLKCVQKISKYNMLVQDMLKEYDVERCPEKDEIHTVLEGIQF